MTEVIEYWSSENFRKHIPWNVGNCYEN